MKEDTPGTVLMNADRGPPGPTSEGWMDQGGLDVAKCVCQGWECCGMLTVNRDVAMMTRWGSGHRETPCPSRRQSSQSIAWLPG